MDLTVDGRRVYAATGGRSFDPAEPAVVLIHGSGMDHTAWALQTRYLAHLGRSVLAVDLPGHGRSEGPVLTGIPALARWITALLDAAGARQAALVGHSLGALIALETAASYPDRVRALALLGVSETMPVNQTLRDAAAANDNNAIEMIMAWGYGQRGHFGGHSAPGLWMLGGGTRLMQCAGSGVLSADLEACNAYERGAQAAASVRCPTLLVLGADDRMTPAKAGSSLGRKIAGAQTTILPGAGHMMMVEQPDATADALKNFV
jgi:pimeloyl-ACP methyl ester carboxylesterase